MGFSVWLESTRHILGHGILVGTTWRRRTSSHREVRFHCRGDRDLPTEILFASGPLNYHADGCCTVSEVDPLLGYVQTLTLETIGESGYPSDMTGNLDPYCLANVGHLVFMKAQNLDVSTDTDVTVIKPWIIERHQQGRALSSIQFIECDDKMAPLFHELVAREAALSVIWSPGPRKE